jgi:carbon-monoxide dehydrogenase large subunit
VTAERFVGRAMRRTEDLRFDPLGATGAGEGGIVATGAAAANAVAAALAPLGVVVRDLPLSPANIARWVREAQRGR